MNHTHDKLQEKLMKAYDPIDVHSLAQIIKAKRGKQIHLRTHTQKNYYELHIFFSHKDQLSISRLMFIENRTSNWRYPENMGYSFCCVHAFNVVSRTHNVLRAQRKSSMHTST